MANGKAAGPDGLTYVDGSTRKVAQLTGDFDRSLGQPTRSQTDRRFGMLATDLGSSFEHEGRLFFLFGDTWGRPGDRDVLAWTDSRSPATITLNVYLDRDGKWLPLTVPGISQGAFEIPSGGVSIGGRIYVVFTTDWSPRDQRMGRSVMAVSSDDGRTFKALYDLSLTKFINVSFWKSGEWLYLFGSGLYRRSSVCLARIGLTEAADRAALRYFRGVGPDGQPQWSPAEQEAVPLFEHNVVGEFSVAYCEPVQRYIVLYNASNPRGITLRSAATPWGPWSEGTVIFDPWQDKGYGHFMHIPTNDRAHPSDSLSDPRREAEWGGEYGPYVMARYTAGTAAGCSIFYTLSTWNPYQVVILHSDLKLAHRSGPSVAGRASGPGSSRR